MKQYNSEYLRMIKIDTDKKVDNVTRYLSGKALDWLEADLGLDFDDILTKYENDNKGNLKH